MDFYEIIVVVIPKLVDAVNQMSAWTYMNIKGQGHKLTLVQGYSDSTVSNFFSLGTTKPIEANFHVKPPMDGGMKIDSNGPGHMTNMAAMPTYGKNIKKSSSQEPKGQWPWMLVFSIGYSSTTKFVQMMTLGWPWLILRQGQITSLMLFVWEKRKNNGYFRNYFSLWYQSW